MEVKGIKLEFLGHSGFLITNGGGKRIAIDPYNLSENALMGGKADIILITHSHYDHCSIKDIEKLAKKGTIVVVSADSQSKITKINDVDMRVAEVGDEIEFGSVKVEVVPAYNINKEFHPKKEGWFGYVIKMRDVIIYHSGDSDKIPEMEKLTGYGKQGNDFIALAPVSGTYVMTAEEAVDAIEMIKPTLAIPMHYGSGVAGTIDDAKRFVELCKERGLSAEILEKI